MVRHALFSLFVASAFACQGEQPSDQGLFMVTGGLRGELREVGCRGQEEGGVKRRMAALDGITSRGLGPFLSLDTGSRFYPTWSLSDDAVTEADARAEVMAEFTREEGVQAMVVSPSDLALGVGRLKSLANRAGLQLFSVNLLDRTTGHAAFPYGAMFKLNGVRVGVVGVSPDLPPGTPSAEAYEAVGLMSEPPAWALQRALRQLRSEGADINVVLMNGPFGEARDLLDEIDRNTVDFVLTTNGTETSELWISKHRVAVYPVMNGGRRLSWVGFHGLGSRKQGIVRRKEVDTVYQSLGRVREDYLSMAKAPKKSRENVANRRRLVAEMERLTADLESFGRMMDIEAGQIPLTEDVVGDLKRWGATDEARLNRLYHGTEPAVCEGPEQGEGEHEVEQEGPVRAQAEQEGPMQESAE